MQRLTTDRTTPLDDKTDWRLIETPPLDAFRNMAIDEAMAQAVRRKEVPPTLRFYGWLTPSISIGYFQHIEDAVDYARCLRSNIPVVRRLTGGRAVLHHNEITYSVAAGSHLRNFQGIHQTYLTLSQGIVRGLRQLGVPAEILRTDQKPRHSSPYCFSYPTKHEIVVSGRKLIGSAQRRWREAFLQHGSLLLKKETEHLSCLRGASSDRVTGLAEYFQGEIMPKEIKDAIVKGMETILDVRFVPTTLTDMEESTATQLIDKYQNWTKR